MFQPFKSFKIVTKFQTLKNCYQKNYRERFWESVIIFWLPRAAYFFSQSDDDDYDDDDDANWVRSFLNAIYSYIEHCTVLGW